MIELHPNQIPNDLKKYFRPKRKNGAWILRNDIVWKKNNCMPSSVKDRFTVDWEHVLFFVSQKKYWFETQYEKLQGKDERQWQGKYNECGSIIQGSSNAGIKRTKRYNETIQGRNKRCVWQINTKPFKEAHFAVFPEELCITPIKSGCPEFICKKCGKAREKIYERGNVICTGGTDNGKLTNNKKFNLRNDNNKLIQYEQNLIGLTDCGCGAEWINGVVLDPFAGSGTTLKVARELGRNSIGIELNPEYIKIIKRRLFGKNQTMSQNFEIIKL